MYGFIMISRNMLTPRPTRLNPSLRRLNTNSSQQCNHQHAALSVMVSFMIADPQNTTDGMNRKAMANRFVIDGK